MRKVPYLFTLIMICFAAIHPVCGQENKDSMSKLERKSPNLDYIERLDTFVHFQSWVSKHQMNYRLVYTPDFKLVLAPNKMNSISLGLTYRYLDVGFSFSPEFLNAAQKNADKGKSDIFSFRTSFSAYRFNLAFEINKVTGFYLKNSREFFRDLPDKPYLLFPNLQVSNMTFNLRYNVNRKFSTAALTGGTQVQRRSAYTFLPAILFATFKFRDVSPDVDYKSGGTHSTDLNFLLPVVGTLVISPKFSATLGLGPSFGVDFFKSLALDTAGKLIVTKGTKAITGAVGQAAISFNSGRLFAGLEGRYRSYGHKIEDISRMVKQYSYYQVYVGWRLRAPGFAKKTLDWVNKVSPIDLD